MGCWRCALGFSRVPVRSSRGNFRDQSQLVPFGFGGWSARAPRSLFLNQLRISARAAEDPRKTRSPSPPTPTPALALRAWFFLLKAVEIKTSPNLSLLVSFIVQFDTEISRKFHYEGQTNAHTTRTDMNGHGGTPAAGARCTGHLSFHEYLGRGCWYLPRKKKSTPRIHTACSHCSRNKTPFSYVLYKIKNTQNKQHTSTNTKLGLYTGVSDMSL